MVKKNKEKGREKNDSIIRTFFLPLVGDFSKTFCQNGSQKEIKYEFHIFSQGEI